MRNETFRRAGLLLPLAVLLPLAASAQSGPIDGTDTRPTGRGDRSQPATPRGDGEVADIAGASSPITFHGGPVLADGTATGQSVNVYYIWYGTWTATQKNILTTLAQSIGDSPYFNINTSYYDTYGPVHNVVNYAGTASFGSSLYGKSLTDADIFSIVKRSISTGALPVDPNGVYFVLTSSGIAQPPGFLKEYCGWHDYATYKSTILKYAFVGDPAKGLAQCAPTQNEHASPNGDVGVDAMASVIAHELTEAATDPQLNAWYDAEGNESADKCAWTFGNVTTVPSGAGSYSYNITLGLNFLLQQLWVNAGSGYCTMSYTGSSVGSLTLSVSPSSQTVAAGSTTGSYTLTARKAAGLSGTVTYSVRDGLPSGAVATVSGDVIKIATKVATPAGTYLLTMQAKDGSNIGDTTATLIVTAP